MLLFASQRAAAGPEAYVAMQAGLCMTQGAWRSDIMDYTSSFGGGFTTTAASTYGPGFFGGLTLILSARVMGPLALDTGLFSWQRGGETEFQTTARDARGEVIERIHETYDWELWYLAVPVAARYSFSSSHQSVYIRLGVEVSTLVDATLAYAGYYAWEEAVVESRDEDVRDSFSHTDWAIVAAAGYRRPLAGMSTFVEVSYTFGLKNVLLVPSDAAELRNRSIGLSVGVLL